ncbi:class I SAM-dependent methyltransferase [bacterium]|nr:class I SAM-dependent methyltransferase [bacterium]
MEKFIKQNVIHLLDSALDIGCNAGAYSKILSDFGFKYVLGIDIVDEMIEKANDFFACTKDNKVIEYKVLNAENLDTNTKYDFILCTEVIEHADNPSKIIENIKSILAPQGIAVITLPNRISIPYLSTLWFHKIKKRQIDKTLEQHLNYPCYKSIKLFRDKNFSVIETDGTNLIFNSVILHLLYKRSMFPLINKLNFRLSRLWPLKYFTQFFFIVLKNKEFSSKGRNRGLK